MNLGALLDMQYQAAEARCYGVVIGVVTNISDPDGLGRVKVRYPTLSGNVEGNWARLATPMAGKDRGLFTLPEVEDEVLLAFELGDMRRPYVLGGLWNSKDTPPTDNADGKNNLRLLKSRSGHLIKLNDEDGKETIEIIDKTGTNSVIIDTASNTVTIAAKNIKLQAEEKLEIEAQELTAKTQKSVKLEAGSTLDVKASSTLNIKGQTVNIN